MTVDHEFLEDVIQKELGFRSMDEFVKQQAYTIFRQKLAETESILSRYEVKYGMQLVEFQQRVIDRQDPVLKQFGLIEKEDDLMDWEFQEHALPYYKQRIEQLAV